MARPILSLSVLILEALHRIFYEMNGRSAKFGGNFGFGLAGILPVRRGGAPSFDQSEFLGVSGEIVAGLIRHLVPFHKSTQRPGTKIHPDRADETTSSA
jgi:hypothetical protein